MGTIRYRMICSIGLGTVLVALAGTARPSAGAAAAPTWVSTAGTVVHLTLIADWNNVNAGFNFDGAAHGQMVVTVPLGDKVVATFHNNARTLHDVVVIPYTKSLPGSGAQPAFPGAASPLPQFRPGSGSRPAAGGPPPTTATTETFSFVANKAGTYLIICGISGHALAGMWDTLVVSSTAKRASAVFGAAVSTPVQVAPAPSASASWVSTSGKTVHLTFIAGYNSANAGFNFNGGAHGQMVVTVPLGDTVQATFKNDARTPHDLVIIPFSKQLPASSVAPAFPGARSPQPQFRPGSGGPSAGGPRPSANASLTFSFVASKAGTYLIICGVPGHALAGMWDRFVVSPTAKAASMTFASS